MDQLLYAEETYRDSVPENLQGSKWHEASEHSIALIQDVIDILAEVY
jgi:hypothetical protein